MKLLVVSTWLPHPPDNGSRVRALHLVRELSRRHAVTLLSFGASDATGDPGPLRECCEQVVVVPLAAPSSGRRAARGLLSAAPRHLVQADNPRMRELVAAHVPRNEAAIALQVDAARYLAKHERLARVFDEAEVTVLSERYTLERRPLRRARHALTWWKLRRFMRSLVGAFDRTTVVSPQEREQLRAAGCEVDRVVVVPNGVDRPDVVRSSTPAARMIYPGAVTYSANLDAVRYFVHEIFPMIRAGRPDLSFWVTGGTDGVGIRELADAGAVFTGRLPEVDSVVADSSVCVVPLRIGGGTRLKVLQAMAVGTPVVSTTKGIEGLEVEPDRHVLVGDSPRAFAGQVLRVMNDESLRARLVRNAQRLVSERYSWRQIADTLEQVLEAAVNDRRRRHLRSPASMAS